MWRRVESLVIVSTNAVVDLYQLRRYKYVVNENTSGDNRMYLNTKLQNLLVKSENHTVNSSFAVSVNCTKLDCSFCKMSINHHYPLVSTPIIYCSRPLFFDLLNLLPPGISLSIDDTYYLYLSTSVAYTTLYIPSITIKWVFLIMN